MSQDPKVLPIGGQDDTAARKRITPSRLVAAPKTLSETSVPVQTPPETPLTHVSNQPIREAKQEVKPSSVPVQTPPETPLTHVSNQPTREAKQEVKPSSVPARSLPETSFPDVSNQPIREVKQEVKPSSVPARPLPETPLTHVSNQPIRKAKQEANPSPALVQTPLEMPFISPSRQAATLTKSYLPSQDDIVKMQEIQERCRQLCLPLFYQEQVQVRSLGFTSALAGEGKTFLAIVAAQVLANDIGRPITLVECNWEHPSLNKQFGLPPTPGLAEWLRGECSEVTIRHQVSRNLTVILAGNGKRGAVKLLHQMLQKGLRSLQTHPDELFIVDLPSIVHTAYGPLAANMVESLVIVVQAQVTSDALVVETCERLKGLPIHGIILNQTKSQIPSWIRHFL